MCSEQNESSIFEKIIYVKERQKKYIVVLEKILEQEIII